MLWLWMGSTTLGIMHCLCLGGPLLCVLLLSLGLSLGLGLGLSLGSRTILMSHLHSKEVLLLLMQIWSLVMMILSLELLLDVWR